MAARTSTKTAGDEKTLNLTTGRSSSEEIESQVQRAQEELLKLRRQQEQIERQKTELETLSRKQIDLEDGCAEMIEKMRRALVMLEREAYESQKRFEQLTAIQESFRDHLSALEAIDPASWRPQELEQELNTALGQVEDARSEYLRARSKVNANAKEPEQEVLPEQEEFDPANAQHDFLYWLKSGMAFTLPLIIFGFFALLILYRLVTA